MNDNWFSAMFGTPLAPAEEAAARQRDEAQNDAKLAAMGLARGQTVRWDGVEWQVVCAMAASEPAVMLHSEAPGRQGFAREGAPIPVSEIEI